MRFVLSTCLMMLPAVAFAAPKDCAVFGEIADHVVVERQKGAEMNDAILAVATQYTGRKERYQPAIPLLADWVYTLPKAQLGKDVGKAYQNACEAQ